MSAVCPASAASDDDRFVTLPSGTRLCCRTHGPDDAMPLLLVAGLGQDLTAWPPLFVDALVESGFRVIRFDNRDSGRSTRIRRPAPSAWRQFVGRPRADAYDLQAMADDAAELLGALRVPAAHVVGMSMGGMIAQTLAASHPAKVRSLTSLISTTGSLKVGQPTRGTMLRLVLPPPRTREKFTGAHLSMTSYLAGRAYPIDPELEREHAEVAWDRALGSEGPPGADVARQLQAIQASGDRTDQLRLITAPTLVVHGDRDLIVAPSGGRATAEAIAGARHVTIPGMGHHLPPGLNDRLIELITEHAREGAPA